MIPVYLVEKSSLSHWTNTSPKSAAFPKAKDSSLKSVPQTKCKKPMQLGSYFEFNGIVEVFMSLGAIPDAVKQRS